MNVHERTLSVLACRVCCPWSSSRRRLMFTLRVSMLISWWCFCFSTVCFRGGDWGSFCGHQRFAGPFQGSLSIPYNQTLISIKSGSRKTGYLYFFIGRWILCVMGRRKYILTKMDPTHMLYGFKWQLTVFPGVSFWVNQAHFVMFSSYSGAKEERNTAHCRQWKQPDNRCNCSADNQKQVRKSKYLSAFTK